MSLLTTSEAAQMLRCTERNIRSMIAEGLIKATRVRARGQLLIDKDDLLSALRQAEQGRIEAAGPGRLHT
jgi:excisionase family DNA binding protein